MRTFDPEGAVVYDIWKKIDNSSNPDEPPRPPRRLTWVKARSFPYYLTKAQAQAELAQVLAGKAPAVRNHYKIVRHALTARMLEQDIACGKVALQEVASAAGRDGCFSAGASHKNFSRQRLCR